MEKKSKESGQWLATTLKSIGEAVMTTDKNGVIKTMNPFAEALTGWKREDASGKSLETIFNVISEDTGKQAENPVTKLIREGSFYGLAENPILITKEGLTLVKEKAMKHNISLKVELDPELEFVEVDKRRFKQIIF